MVALSRACEFSQLRGLRYLFCLACLGLSFSVWSACELRMGFRTTDRLPLIAAEPDNRGLYLDLYRQAARRVGCTLSVVRAPKNRILQYMETGQVDFYPGLSYSPERLDMYLFYPNGLPQRNVGLTLLGVPPIRSYEQLRGKTMLLSQGGPQFNVQQYGILLRQPPELTFERGIELVASGQVYFFRDDQSTLSYYLRKSPDKARLMLHPDCCEPPGRFTMAISLKSRYAAIQPNPAYRFDRPRTIDNEPRQLKPGTVMWRFVQAVDALSNEGITRKLYAHYFGMPMPPLE